MAEYICGVGETYPNLDSLAGVIANDDVISLTDTGVIVEPCTVSYGYAVTIRSHPSNANRAQVQLVGSGGTGNGFQSLYASGTTFLFKDVDFFIDTFSNRIFEFLYSSNAVIFDSCEIYDLNPAGSSGLIAIHIHESGDVKVRNCKFRNLPSHVIWFSDYSSKDIEILNNVVFNFAVGASSLQIALCVNLTGNLYMLNNIVHGNGNAYTVGIELYLVGSPSVVQDYNCIHGCAIEYSSDAVTAPHNRDSTQTPGVTDPLFKDPVNGNLKLNINSLCIDAGAGTGVYSGIPTVDFMDSTRPYVWADKSSVDNGTDMGAYEMNPSYYSTNTFDQTSAAPNQQVTSSLDKDWVVHQVQAAGTDTYFDATSELSSVIVRYTHEDGRQRKTIIHSGSGLQGQTSWPEGARDGTWEKTEVISYDANGAVNTLLRSDIGTEEDIAMTDGTMSLNS